MAIWRELWSDCTPGKLNEVPSGLPKPNRWRVNFDGEVWVTETYLCNTNIFTPIWCNVVKVTGLFLTITISSSLISSLLTFNHGFTNHPAEPGASRILSRSNCFLSSDMLYCLVYDTPLWGTFLDADKTLPAVQTLSFICIIHVWCRIKLTGQSCWSPRQPTAGW